ncbi:MAG: helix-turn-helix transcriptional regulator [Actinobacteria bacterium]|nr:helix-turn-helix transcriptional regulator [Actinomycetota bacterium]
MTKLEKILKERGIKQVWLAERINKSPSELNRWLKGKRIPAYKNMCKISKALNIPVEDIFFNGSVKVSTNDNYSTGNTSINNNKKLEINAKDLQVEEKEYINKP